MLPQKPKTFLRLFVFRAAFIFLSVLIAVALLEMILLGLLKHPRWAVMNENLFTHVRWIYENYAREDIQYSEPCAQYDPELFYRLKPGRCRSQESEFKSDYRINSAGLRDTEEALLAPTVIAIGDSSTMGWGVDQEETFPKQLEKMSGLKTLNAGIASYGTAREGLLLSKLDRTKLSYLILQYCENDCDENDDYVKNNRRLKVLPEATYRNLQRELRRQHSYYPGKYTTELFRSFLVREESKEAQWLHPKSTIKSSSSPEDDSPRLSCEELLIKTLGQLDSLDLSRVRIVFLDLELDHKPIPDFIDNVRRLIQNPALPSFFRRITILNTQEILTKEKHFHLLDDHMNAEGHKVIAQAIWNVIRTEEEKAVRTAETKTAL